MLIGLDSPAAWIDRLNRGLVATGAKVARLDNAWMTTTTAADAAVNAAHAAGAQPLILASNWQTIMATQLRALAQRYYPLGLRFIEFGNETSYRYQSGSSSTSGYKSIARSYATKAKAATQALAGTGVALLVQADDADQGSVWVDEMYAAVPNLHTLIGGWTIHPYGPDYLARLGRLVSQTGKHGSPASKPIFLTEDGVATDNGRTLSSNYGWPTNLTYVQAGETMTKIVADVRADFPQVAQFIVFQAIDQAVSGSSTDREGYFGVLKRDGSIKPGYTEAIKALGA